MESLLLAKRSRIHCLNMVYKANASHIASALSIIDILAVLYNNFLNVFENDINNSNRDRFLLSKGHACVAVYAILAESGFFNKEELKNYGKDGSLLMNHISHKVPGVEFSSGSLGHGLPFGVGKALVAKKMFKDWKTYVLMSDGEMQEGSNWEGFMFASHHKLDNLVVIIDYNNLQSLTTVKDTLNILPLDKKLESFGWHVCEINGHDHNEINNCLELSKSIVDKPVAIIANTIKGKGVSFMENSVKWHYKYPSEVELKKAIKEIESA